MENIDLSSQSKLIGKRYQLLEKIGEGGMGVVYLAHDRLNNETVALKQVQLTPDEKSSHHSPPQSVMMLRQFLATEFELLASLRHPHIIAVRDYGFDRHGQPYYTMAYLPEAQTLREASQDLSIPEKLTLIQQVLQALAYLHRRGVLHRDIKPANILVVNGEARLLDFGMAQRTAEANKTPSAGGTMVYWAPEQWKQGQYSEATDLFAIGVVLYEFLSGRHPFEPIDDQFFYRVLFNEPYLEHIRLDYPISDFIAQLLEKHAENRYPDASAALQELTGALNQENSYETADIRESYLQAATFVGRQTELTQLRTALTDLSYNRSSIWLIGGESGVGKSRLLSEIRIHALVKGLDVIEGVMRAEGSAPFELWRAPLRRLLLLTEINVFQASILKDIIPDIEELLGLTVSDPPPLEGEPYQSRLAITIVEILRSLSHPTLIILEDLQWAHENLIILKQISNLIASLPGIMILGSFRTDEYPDLPQHLPTTSTITLSRLTQADILELSQAMLGKSGTNPQIISFLTKETEGNVFFILEVIRALAEEVGRLDQIGRTTLPKEILTYGMQDLLQRRTAKVAPDDRQLLELAAIAGRDLDFTLLATLIPSQNIEQWTTRIAAAMIISVRNDRWSFSHDKLRDAVLSPLSQIERQNRHRNVAQGIEAIHADQSDFYEILLYHWSQAADLDKELFYVPHVVKPMIELTGDHARARQLLNKSLDQLEPNDPRRLPLLNLLAKTLQRTSDFQQVNQIAIEIHQQAVAHQDTVHLANAIYLLGLTAMNDSHYEEAEDNLTQAISLYTQLGDPHSIAEAYLTRALLFLTRDIYPQAAENAKQALTIAQEHQDTSSIIRSLGVLGTATRFQGRYDEAKTHIQDALSLAEDLGDRLGIALQQNGLGVAEAMEGNYPRSKHHFEQSLAIYREIGDRQGTGRALNNIGLILSRSLEYDKAKYYYAQSAQIREEIGDRAGILTTLNNQGVLAYNLGQHDQATHFYQTGLKLAQEINLTRSISNNYNNLAMLAYGQDLYDQAESLYRLSLVSHQETGDTDGQACVYANLGALYLAQNRLAEAQLEYTNALKIRAENNHTIYLVDNWVGLGLIAIKQEDFTAAQEYATKVLAVWQDDPSYHTAEERFRTFHLTWELCRKLGLPQESQVLKAAIELMESILEKHPDEEIQATFLSQKHHAPLWEAGQADPTNPYLSAIR